MWWPELQTLGDKLPKHVAIIRPQNPETAAVLADHQAAKIQEIVDATSARLWDQKEKEDVLIQDAQDGLLAKALEEEEEQAPVVPEEPEWAPISSEVPHVRPVDIPVPRRRPAEPEFTTPLPRLPKISGAHACHVCRDLAKCPFISKISGNFCAKCLKPVCEKCKMDTRKCVKCQRS